IFLLLIPFFASAQEFANLKITPHDSLQLDTTFKRLITAIQEKDEAEVLEISLPELYCVECYAPGEESSAFISAKEHYDALQNFANTITYKSLSTKGYGFYSANFEDMKPKNIPLDYTGDFIDYEVIVEDSENPSSNNFTIFFFVKLNKEFKLFGISRVPYL
ncbi:MAG TPA: hypothetical protein VEA37_09895, partial [Flavobacterium sp.]|nr:hypothetical protein [Flavobacterium sp.]